MNGTVIGGSNNVFTVECDDGTSRQCSIKGKKLKAPEKYYNPLAPGDCVEIEADENDSKQGQILSLIPRKNAFVRWNVKGRAPQLLAANIDQVFCFTTPDSPPFRPRFVDRLLAQAEEAEITPIILCNKYDLIMNSDAETRLKEWERIGYQVLRVSARTGEGIPELASILEDKRSVFFGQSGVGKSSVVNVLDSTVVLKTGSLSQKYDRGQHTTTRGNLYHLQLNESLMDGRFGAVAHIIDTPGVRRFVLDGIKADNLILYFKEFLPFVGQCQFGMSCTHTHENGCKVLQAVQNGKISIERFESWQRIKEEIITGSWED